MIPPSTAREALIVETLGDMAALVDRVEALVPALQETRQALIDASAQLSGQLRAFEERMTTITENAKVQAVRHIAQRTDEMARKSMHVQALAIADAARTSLGTEIRPTLQGLVAPLQHLAHLAHQRERPWERWLMHVATAAVASAASWVAAAWLWIR